jgi:hypothetical protein
MKNSVEKCIIEIIMEEHKSNPVARRRYGHEEGG